MRVTIQSITENNKKYDIDTDCIDSITISKTRNGAEHLIQIRQKNNIVAGFYIDAKDVKKVIDVFMNKK